MLFWRGEEVNLKILELTSGDDLKTEQHLIEYVKKALILHGTLLYSNKLINKHEYEELKKLLNKVEVRLTLEEEDAHTAIFNVLKKINPVLSNKIRMHKSRNEEIAIAETYFFIYKLSQIRIQLKDIVSILEKKEKEFTSNKWIGFTHTRMATTGKADQWISAYKSLFNMTLLRLNELKKTVSTVSLGSGPGFGSKMTIKDLEDTKGLKVVSNPQLMQHLRILKHQLVTHYCLSVSAIISRLASDIIFYYSDNNAYIFLGEAITQGSSAMPHKRNPDVFEIIRANHSKFIGWTSMANSTNYMISGYHRDYQIQKEAGINSTNLLLKELEALKIVIPEIKLNSDKIKNDIAEKTELESFSKLSNVAKKGKDVSQLYKQYSKKQDIN